MNKLYIINKNLDRITPIYKSIIDDLSPVQQELFHYVAINWNDTDVNFLTSKIRDLSSKEISSQLNQLKIKNIIESNPKNNKDNMYHIKDDVMKFWYIFRSGKESDKEKLNNLILDGQLDHINFDEIIDKALCS